MLKLDLLGLAWAIASVAAQTTVTAVAIARPDLVGGLHFGAFAMAAGGMLSVVFHKQGEPNAVRRLFAGTALAGVAGAAAGVAWSEWTGHGNIALAIAVGSACLTVWGVSGRDVFVVIERLLSLWRGRKD